MIRLSECWDHEQGSMFYILQIGAHMVSMSERMSETQMAFAIEKLTNKFTNTSNFYHDLLMKRAEEE